MVVRAKELGVRLAVEPTNPLRTDVSFVHTVRDAVDLARMADIAIVVDFYASWYERGLEETVRKNIDVVALVQICDYKLGTFNMPNRCAVGDGDIPVERLLGMVLDAGYEGAFDLEILGPQDRRGGLPGPDHPQPRTSQRDARPPRRVTSVFCTDRSGEDAWLATRSPPKAAGPSTTRSSAPSRCPTRTRSRRSSTSWSATAIFERAWLHVGRVEQIPRTGSYFTKEIVAARTSIIVVAWPGR